MDYQVRTTSEWVLLLALVGSVLLLNQVVFQLPPEGNNQSMDSAVYLACIFTFGLQLTLEVLLLSTVIYAILKRKLEWWKHLFNFSVYCIMITAVYNVFTLLGGKVGPLDSKDILIYIISLFTYFLINSITFALYFYILMKRNFLVLLKSMLKETAAEYVSMLLLSLVLCMIIPTDLYFGLLLFLVICVMLSLSFQQFYYLYQQVSDKATRDRRTGLYNHGYFEELLEKELKQAKDADNIFSLIVMDIDSFKTYNDTFGHMKGDKLLGFFGGMLSDACKTIDCIVARYGGDEFTILMQGKTEKEAFSFINNVRKKVNDSYFEGVEIFPHGCLTFSAGIAQYRKEIHDKSQLLDKADQAMYYAKVQGKNLAHIYNEQSLIPESIDIEQEVAEIEQQLKIFLSKDIYTFQHSKRVFSYAMDVCEYIPLSQMEKRSLILGALFHDIGKLEVPKHILQKQGKLDAEEWMIVKKHVEWGKEIVSAIGKYSDLLPLIELHHERMDGKGYPHGLKGEEIPKIVRVLSVIDSFDAMTTERPYQPTKTFDEAIQELKRCSGSQFDPVCADAFIQMIEKKYDFKLDSSKMAGS
ncbi:bifunctional diguanylate cyclase/phosphohydrolase [Paenibacillus marinisediminis]